MTSRPTTWPPASARRWSWPVWPYAGSAASATSSIDPALLTTDAEALVTRGDIDIVVEVIGGIEPARVADHVRLDQAASRRHRQQGAARRGRRRPCTRPPRSTAATSTSRPPSPAPSRCCGRCASPWPATRSTASSASSTAPPTTSSTRWTPRAPSFTEALDEAQALGYAEADPTADVEGFDAAAKAAILAGIAFHTPGDGRRGAPRGHHRDHRRRRRLGQGDGLRHQAAGHLRAAPTTAARSASACTRR